MPKVSPATAERHLEMGPGEAHSSRLADTTTEFVTINADADLAPLLVGLPDDKCQCPHWGYVTKGTLTFTYADRTEVLEAGDAFYITPGHTPKAVGGTQFVMFSPADELAIVEAHMASVVQAG